MTVSSGAVVQPVRARVKSTSSLQQPIVAQHFAIPPPASVPSSRRSTSSQSSTPPTPSAIDTLMPACPTGWARFDLSPLSEVTQDTSSSAAVRQTTSDEFPSQTCSDTELRIDDSQACNFAKFPSSSVQDEQNIEHPSVTEDQLTNDKFSDSFLASRDSVGFDDVKHGDTVVASSSFELMSPSSDKDSISLPSPEAPPPPLPENVVTTDLPCEPPAPPPRPRVHANSQVGHGVELSVEPVTARSDSVHSSPVLAPPAAVTLGADESPAAIPPATVANMSVISNHSQHITSSEPKSRFTVQLSSVQSAVNNAAVFPLAFPSDDAAPPPLPPRNVPVSGDAQRQQLMRGTSLPASGKIHSVNDVPPPPPPRRSLSKPFTSSRSVDPFAPIPVSVPVPSVPAKQPAVVAEMLPFSSGSSVVETTIAPLPRPRPHLRQTELVSTEAVSSTVGATTSSGSSSPWHLVSTPPIIEQVSVDPFSNVDPFAGSVSPDDPFAEPSLDGMLSDLCHDFDSDTLSMTAFRTRAVTIDSVSSDVYDTASAVHQHEASSVSNESRSSNHGNAADVSAVVQQTAQTSSTEAVGTGCLVDLNTADDTDHDGKWQPFADKLTAFSGTQAASGFALYRDLQDVWYGSGSVDWNPEPSVTSHSDDIAVSMFDTSVSSLAVEQVDSALASVSDIQPVVSILDTSPSDVAAHQRAPCTENASMNLHGVTDTQTSIYSLQSHSATDQRSTTGFDDVTSHSMRAVSEPPELSQVVSTIDHRNSSFDAVFGQFDDYFTSSLVVSTANGTSAVTNAAVAVSNAMCSGELTTTSSVPSTQHSNQHVPNSTDLTASDVQVTQ